MRLLLDTHTVLWATTQPALLSPTARTVIADTSNEVLVSAVVAWELSIKHHLGKLPEAAPLLADFPTVVVSLAAQTLPVEPRHGVLAGGLLWSHKDPFDRMLAAQATIEGAVLVGRDATFDAVPGLARVW
ncbi:MAG: type II toxin-antitoxin system VapC family toxin [Micrococcales bacterium]|nr:type II toxin-antitoxin system VapC family toxin [Micrococcales bacterium]